MGIKITEDNRASYEARLLSAIAYVDTQTSGKFTDNETHVTTFPPDVQVGVALLVEDMGNYKKNGEASRTLSDMSVSFFEGAGYKSAAKYWRRHVKARFY